MKITANTIQGLAVATLFATGLAMTIGCAQADVNIPGRSKAAMRSHKRQGKRRSIQFICPDGSTNTTGCGGGTWKDVNGVKVHSPGTPGKGSPKSSASGH